MKLFPSQIKTEMLTFLIFLIINKFKNVMFLDICNSLFNRLLASFSTGGHIFSRRNSDLNGLIIRQSSLNSLLSTIKPMCSPFFFIFGLFNPRKFQRMPIKPLSFKIKCCFLVSS